VNRKSASRNTARTTFNPVHCPWAPDSNQSINLCSAEAQCF